MRLDEYVAFDGLALAELVRRGETTPETLAGCARAAIERVNGTLNAVTEVFDPPEAGGVPGAPFYGVPFLVKDLVLQVRGRKCELGSELARGLAAQYDTHLMERFRAAGLHTLGRTTTPELGYCATTEARLYGPTRNPWDTSRMPGGSSGGSAAAVAAGIVPLAHANDGGGSIRIPAACCGLVGLKPTRGRTPLGPDAGEALFGLAIEFAVSRTVRDSAMLLDAVQGPMPGDKYVIIPPVRPFAEEIATPPGRLRIGYTARPWSGTAVDPEVAAALEATAARLAELGHEVVEGAPPLDYARYIDATLTLWSANVAHWADLIAVRTGRAPGPDTLQATTLAVYEHGRRLGANDVFVAVDTMNAVSRAAAPFFEDHDLLLTPTCASPALPIGEMNADDPTLDAAGWTEKVFAFAPFTALFNMTGQPAISLPLARTRTGLPIGMQLVGRWGDEATLLRVAAALEQAYPWPRLAPLASGTGV